MAGRDVNPYGFGAFKVYAADQLTNPNIKKLSNYFNFPPALSEKLEGDGLGFVNTLVERGIIKETDISGLLNALKIVELCGIQDDLKEKFMGCREVVPRVENDAAPNEPFPTPEGGEPSKTSTNDVTKPVFISFSYKDLTKVEEIVATFEKALGPQTCWMYTTGIKGGQIIDEKIDRALDKAKVVVCMISQDFIDSGECEREVMLAEHREKEIIAVHIESVQRPYQYKDGGESALQLKFARHLYMNLTGEDVEKKMQILIARIKDFISQADNQSPAQVPSPLKPSPSPGGGEPSKTSTDDDTKPVFISFSSKDLTKVQEIVATFEEALGPKPCWMYTTGIKGGQIIDEKIDRALAEAKVVVCMISQDYIDSGECEREVLVAEQNRKKIIPVHIENVKFPYEHKDGDKSALQSPFARRLYMKLTGKDMENEIQKLIERIKELISHEDNQSTATEMKDLPLIPFFCAYCQIIFKESRQHQYHTETEKHKGNINIIKDDEKWAFGEPPLGITDGKFKLCPEQSGECSGCLQAHSQKELDEWNKQHKYRLEALYNYQQHSSEDMTDQMSKVKTLVQKYEEEKQKNGGDIKNVGNISYLKAPDQIIAKGSEGALIYVGKYNDAYVAVKRIPIENIQREKELLIKMQDKDLNNVVKIVCIEKDEDFYYVVTPLCECDLESFIKAGSLPSQLQQIELCLDILNGLMSLHSLDIVHRDLKPSNVLINKKGDALLTDFGISKICIGTSTNYTAAIGSQGWLASECITAASEQKDIPLLKASDIQVAGCLVYYILSNGFHPFDATGCLNVLQLQQNITDGKFQLLHLETFPKECKSLLTDMLDKEVEKRPGMEDCLHKMKEVKTLLIQQLSEEIQPSLPDVEVLCGESSIDMTKDRNSKQTWSFRVKSGKNMAQSTVKWCIFTVLFLLQFAKSTEFCDQKPTYLRLGSRGLVSCDFGEFRVIGWLVGEDVDDRSPTILVEDSQTKGPGYENGEYDMFQNGSLIINKVTLQHEQMFTARIVRDTDVEHYTIEVKVYVLPVPVYPVVNGLTNQQHVVIDDYSGGQVNCAIDRVRPNIQLELVFLDHVPQDVSLSSIRDSSVNNTDGTYNVSLVSTITVGSNLIGRLTLQCRVAGQMANYFPAVTLIDVLVLSNGLWQSYPTINGLTNQQHVVLDINRGDELTCLWNGVPKYGYLKWDIINPSSDGITMTDNYSHTRDNGDGTYDLLLNSTLSVPNPSVLRVTVHCKVAAPADHWYPEITTAELLLPANFDCLPAFPVINGLTSQQHVVLDVQRKDVLTCSMHRVSQEVSLQWLIITPDSSEDISLDDQLSRSDNEDGTVNITLNSTVTVTSLSINRVTLQCKVSGLPADSPQVSSSQVELLFPTISKDDLSQSSGIVLTILLVMLSICTIYIIIIIIICIRRNRRRHRLELALRNEEL